MPAQRAAGEAVGEEQHEAHDEGQQAEGGDAHQHARVFEEAEENGDDGEEDLHYIALRGGRGGHDGQRRHEVRHHDHRADAGAVEDH